jgi:hypothetical protein
VFINADVDDSVIAILNRYTLYLNTKLKASGGDTISRGELIIAILTMFAMEHCERISDGYRSASVNRIKGLLPEHGYSQEELAAVIGDSGDTPEGTFPEPFLDYVGGRRDESISDFRRTRGGKFHSWGPGIRSCDENPYIRKPTP